MQHFPHQKYQTHFQLQEMLKEGFLKYDLELIKYSASNPHHTDENSLLVKW